MTSITDLFKFFSPIHDAWWAIFGVTLNSALGFIYSHVAGVPIVSAIGAYGVAIIILTILIPLLLAPLQHFPLVTQRKTLVEQRKLAPPGGELRQKYNTRPQ